MNDLIERIDKELGDWEGPTTTSGLLLLGEAKAEIERLRAGRAADPEAVEAIAFLTKWADDINANSGPSVDADSLRSIAELLDHPRIGTAPEALEASRRLLKYYTNPVRDEAIVATALLASAASRAAVWAECREACAKVADAVKDEADVLPKGAFRLGAMEVAEDCASRLRALEVPNE